MPIDVTGVENHPLMKDPYVTKILELSKDKSLYEKSSSALEQLRLQLFRDSLDYFSRNNSEYVVMLENLDINPKSVEFEDLVDIAVTSDFFRGDGQKKYIIGDVPLGGPSFQSSGTSGKDPVRIYRSPIDILVQRDVNTNGAESVLGHELNGGEAMFLAAPELKDFTSFVAFVEDAFSIRDIDIKYGMKVVEDPNARTIWEKLRPDTKTISSFYKSKQEPKYLMTAPVGIYRTIKQFEDASPFLKYIIYGLYLRVPPIKLGKGGAIFTGGGIKGSDIPSMEKIMEMSKEKIVAKDENNRTIPAPFIDCLSHTENLAVLFSKPNSLVKMPHPLSHVFLVDKETFKPIEGYGKGVVGIFNPFTTTYLEAFYPGDMMERVPDDNYYGSGFLFKRRLTKEEGWDLERACGGGLEEAYKKK